MNDAILREALRLHQAGQLAEAARLYATIANADPRHFQALYLLGFIHLQVGQFKDAERYIAEALKIDPRSPDAHYNRGYALQNMQRHQEAVACFNTALTLKPDYSDAATNLGVSLLALKRPAEALASFDRALVLNPGDIVPLSNRGTAFFELRRYDEAATDYARLFALVPDHPYTFGNLVLSRAYGCDWRSRAGDMKALSAALATGKPVLQAHASTLICESAQEQLQAARVWVRERCPPSPSPLWKGERYRHDRIRVAYVSADFYAHATAYLIAGVFEHHDKSRFETIGVSLGPNDGSETRARLEKSFGRFIDVHDKSDAEIAGLLRRTEIDIAVDLKGFTVDARPGIFAARPAPVQVNYLGYPGTMGADYIDYILADRTLIGETDQAFYSEKIAYLPGSYQANDGKRTIAERTPSRAEAGLPENGFVFCSFNNSYKIVPEIFDVWMRLLKAVDGSVLWLLDDNAGAVRNLKREAEARGVADERLVFAPRAPLPDHLARQRLADLFLDTLPCNAHTTASDALWGGLPVLTCMGKTFAGRVAASLLRATGLPELVAPSLASYEKAALKLARDPNALAAIKAKLAANRDVCPLFDTARYTRNLEAAYTAMWQRAERDERPEHLSVEEPA